MRARSSCAIRTAGVEKDRIEPLAMPTSVGVGSTGLLVGIIGAPLGMLVGGMSGLMVGSLVDLHDAEQTVSDLHAISSATRLGHTALLAAVSEQSPEVIDTAMARLRAEDRGSGLRGVAAGLRKDPDRVQLLVSRRVAQRPDLPLERSPALADHGRPRPGASPSSPAGLDIQS
jgi:hypothetical protein